MGEFIENITSLFKDTGSWCADCLNAALNIYSKLVTAGLNMLNLGTDEGTFADFWSIVNVLTRVLGAVATTLMVLLFVSNLATASWDGRHEINLWDFVKMCLKFMVAIVLVNNATAIVTGIVNSGAAICTVLSKLAPGETSVSLAEMDLCLSDINTERLVTGVSGFRGLLFFLLCLFAVLAIITSGVTIMLEIYQRIMKLYVLIPFSTISFSTIIMGDGNGGSQIFEGYLKNIISVALESVVITVMIYFSFVMVNGSTMDALFPTEADDSTITIEVSNVSELNALYFSTIYSRQPFDRADYEDYVIWDELSDDVLSVIGYDGDKNCLVSDRFKDDDSTMTEKLKTSRWASSLHSYTTVYIGDESLGDAFLHGASLDYPCTLTGYKELSWAGLFMLVLQISFPCLLAASCVKMAGQISHEVMGR